MDNIHKPEFTKEKNKATEEFKRHRKQSFWQVYIPIIIILALFIFAIVLMVITTVNGDPNGIHSKYADLITMGIISILSILTLIIIAILGVSIYYLGLGINKTPTVTNQVKFYINLGNEKVKQVMDAITLPIIKAGGAANGAQQMINRVVKKKTD